MTAAIMRRVVCQRWQATAASRHSATIQEAAGNMQSAHLRATFGLPSFFTIIAHVMHP